MKAELVSLDKGGDEGIYNAVLKISDESGSEEPALRQALERSVRSLNALSGLRERIEEIDDRANRLLAATVAREKTWRLAV